MIKNNKAYISITFQITFQIPFKIPFKYLSNAFLKGIKVPFSPFERYERTLVTDLTGRSELISLRSVENEEFSSL